MKLIDGKAYAQRLRADVAGRVSALKARGIQPGFAAILVGQHPPSLIYVRNKLRAMEQAGITARVAHLPEHASAEELVQTISDFNKDPRVHGILLQLPLPEHLAADKNRFINEISPEKDVDGLTLINVGKRTLGLPCLLPCTPKGALRLIKHVMPDIEGARALVIGRSDLVGKPMAQLLLREDCTVIHAHSMTKDLPDLCRTADILVAAIGQPQFVQGSWIKKDAIVIDVGINRVGDQLVGDVDFETASRVAHAITPVPGGVGPMTIACLLENTVEAIQQD